MEFCPEAALERWLIYIKGSLLECRLEIPATVSVVLLFCLPCATQQQIGSFLFVV
jgi:hypothetical protein